MPITYCDGFDDYGPDKPTACGPLGKGKVTENEHDWRLVMQTETIQMHRTGWPGAWDAIVSAIRRTPRRTAPETVVIEMYVRGPLDVKFEAMGLQAIIEDKRPKCR